MTVFREFADDLIAVMQKGQPQPLMCSRAEFAVVGTSATVIFRTEPALTDAYLSCEPFTYPIPMVANVSWVSWYAAPYIKDGRIVPTTSELMRAAVVNVLNNRSLGAWCDKDMLYVPEAIDPSRLREKRVYSAEEKWSGVLYTSELSGLESHPDIPSFAVVHVPDMPNAELTDDVWIRLGRLAWGWNYSGLFSEDVHDAVGRALRHTVSRASTIAVFR